MQWCRPKKFKSNAFISFRFLMKSKVFCFLELFFFAARTFSVQYVEWTKRLCFYVFVPLHQMRGTWQIRIQAQIEISSHLSSKDATEEKLRSGPNFYPILSILISLTKENLPLSSIIWMLLSLYSKRLMGSTKNIH